MKISYNWLGEYIRHGLSVDELSDALTSIGLEIEEVEPYSSSPLRSDGLVIGHVLDVKQHPNADRLRVTRVDVGGDEALQIVCGAPNVAEGQRVVVATVGATLHPTEGEPFAIKKSKIRGEESQGMICAEDEIGLGKSHEGIMVLPNDAPIGKEFSAYLGGVKDSTLTINLTPNRVDAACHIGVARDLCALLDKDLRLPAISFEKHQMGDAGIEVNIEDAEGCPRYSGIVVRSVKVAPSPDWLANRLKAAGLSPINNIVDITNFVMFEMGQPLHAFDLSKIKGGKIVVKKSEAGDEFVTLDSQKRTLDGSELMICNAEEPMAIAGIFGGLESGISENTQDVFIESAYFKPSFIRRTAKKHGLKTDASFRYERGTDPNGTLEAMLRAAYLMQEIAGGEVQREFADEYPVTHLPAQIRLPYGYLNDIAGDAIPHGELQQILVRLGFAIRGADPESLQLEVPTFKSDVLRPIDVVEDVLRIYSFNRIPVPAHIRTIYQVEKKAQPERMKIRLSDLLLAQGFSEAMHLTFAAANELANEEAAIPVLNPLSADLGYLRDNLLRSGLRSIVHNANRQQPDVKLFEWSADFLKAGEKNIATHKLALWATGLQAPESWYGKAKKTDFFYLKGLVRSLLRTAGLTNLKEEDAETDWSSEALQWKQGKTVVATIGQMNSKIQKAFDLKAPVFYAEILSDLLLNPSKAKPTHYEAYSRFPRVERDLALVVPKDVKFGDVLRQVKEGGTALLTDVRLFDVYEGEQVEKGFKSYAVRLLFENKESTLEDRQIEKITDFILQRLDKNLGVKLRK